MHYTVHFFRVNFQISEGGDSYSRFLRNGLIKLRLFHGVCGEEGSFCYDSQSNSVKSRTMFKFGPLFMFRDWYLGDPDEEIGKIFLNCLCEFIISSFTFFTVDDLSRHRPCGLNTWNFYQIKSNRSS